ncbi:MAG: SEC-C domain-containing protein [Candidatus Cellulosilyticum pullistercoris]|uniref:SEC-C domain-containing protein n=1 Tax=Candidatus Cellulosilyticum pullistercoris TaxID=2838521 RepID=A0A9E2KB46_9FIRM|nr:SEC-C domain-containing protein [Candidatus Cellulosilyticum pullistercoris]
MELAYGKKELEQIAKLYGVKGAYKLKKAELVEALLEAIPNKMPEILPMVDEADIKRFEALLSQDKIVEANESLDAYYNLMELELVQFVEDKKESRLRVPSIIKEAYEKIDMAQVLPKIKRNSMLREFIISILNLYGVVEVSWAVTLFNKYYTPETNEVEITNMVKNDMRLVCQSKIMDNYIVEETIYALDKNNFKDFLGATVERDYFIPSKELLEKVNDEVYYEPSLQVEKLKSHIRAKYLKDEAVIEEAIIAVTMISKVDCDKTGKTMELILEELVNLGIEFKSLADINEMIKHISPVINVTRKWINKGFTAQELSPHTFDDKTGQKVKVLDIGRNAPCPCGSGKKYKKCCGK